MIRLSSHFSLEEFTVSETAARRGIKNSPPEDLIPTLKHTANHMEIVRNVLRNHPIQITSGYRCLELNHAIGSKDTSAHVQGRACDFICPGFGTPLEICRRLAEKAMVIEFDQLIMEHSWVHIAFGGDKRSQILTLKDDGSYVAGLPAPA